MRKIHGLNELKQDYGARLNVAQLAAMLIEDLHSSFCDIYGALGNDDRVLLARLDLLPETLIYEAFDQRLDWSVSGVILRNDCVPLTYRMQGRQLAITGRCSVIARVCGVDLYLHNSYTCVTGDVARQRFSLAVKPLLSL